MSRRNRKRKSEEQRISDGEQDNFFSDEMKEEMEIMWEIPQIFHFLHLTRESLNIPQFSIYEMERMLLIPKASKQLANIMTCLLSSPITKAKLRKVPPMPYEFWTNILTHKMASWFKVYHAKHKDATKVLETIGVEPEFWNIFPDASLLEGKYFEDLSFKQRVWLLKTVCDTIMHTRKTVQEDIAKQPWEDQFETVLGVDRYGTKYIYFPQFFPNDLRIYRHCLNNKILSTVGPVKAKEETETDKLIGARLSRYKKKKLQSYNNAPCRRSTRHSSIGNKDLNNYKCNNDSAANSFISEDTNMSNTSTCTNNNNISLNPISRKRCRSLSKMSEESTLSNTRSSGYDTNTSSDNKSVDNVESSPMFKGFINTQSDNCGIGIINEMLDDLKSEIDEERRTNERESNNSELSSQGNLVKVYKNTIDSCEILAVERDENERSSDNLSNSSKTDDEKLNDIISAENSKLPENVYAKSISASDNVSDISTLTSKSDDEKLSETKTSDSNVNITFNDSLCASPSIDSVSLSEKKTKSELRLKKVEVSSIAEIRSDNSIEERNLRKRTRLRSRYRVEEQHNEESKIEAVKNEKKKEKLEADKMDEANEKNFSVSKLDLHEDVEYDLDDYTNNSDIGYNLRRSKDPKTDECKKHFDKMLSDLSVSDFQLVADTVEGLRDLIGSFSANDSGSKNAVEMTPPCEVTLVMKLTELLNFLEPMEAALKDTMRKTRAKLQREWSNFKEGAGIHCQLPETQRYKRYRNLPYPHLAPKKASNSDDRPSVRARSRIPSKVAARVGKRVATNGGKETARNNRMSRHHRQEETKLRREERSGNTTSNTVKTRVRRTTKMRSNRRDEYYERVEFPRTQNNFIQTTRATRTSWRNGPTLRQSTRLPAHRTIHPLFTLLRKSDTLTISRKRRTQTKIGFYRALAKGKINVRLPIED